LGRTFHEKLDETHLNLGNNLSKISASKNLLKHKFSRLHLRHAKMQFFASNNTLEQGRNAYFLCQNQKMHKTHKPNPPTGVSTENFNFAQLQNVKQNSTF